MRKLMILDKLGERGFENWHKSYWFTHTLNETQILESYF
jgi:hypothetical protein